MRGPRSPAVTSLSTGASRGATDRDHDRAPTATAPRSDLRRRRAEQRMKAPRLFPAVGFSAARQQLARVAHNITRYRQAPSGSSSDRTGGGVDRLTSFEGRAFEDEHRARIEAEAARDELAILVAIAEATGLADSLG